ncbi:hypothetical protein EU803_04370 [Loktanella sp. IMCC34160]|uniref:hypothetical protein n=1 Tax=Loktanella sp. IMCC34160 TaxID=2510646 RepID=UPI00101D0F80|nr:hypothetical protein [Loktanella sp. IMCC34160]RYG93339.1 hypothetical protein EU803_04370 [Loktanella sp. IMCC34160]
MTKLCSAEWATKARKRKAIRDHYRDKFFAENGITKGADPLKFSGAPQNQRERVLKLMEITKSGGALTNDQVEMLETVKAQIMTVGLGSGELGAQAATTTSFDPFSYANLKKFFF